MSIISKPHTFSPNTVISSSQMNANMDTIYNEFNGNISNINIASNANIAGSKLAENAIGTRELGPGAAAQDNLADNIIGIDQLIENIPIKAIAAGRTSSFTLGSSNTKLPVSFPSGRFSSTPIVVATFERSADNGHAIIKVQSPSESGFDALMRNESDTGTWSSSRVNWIAIELE